MKKGGGKNKTNQKYLITQHIEEEKNKQKKIAEPLQICIGSTIRIGRES